MGGLLRALPLIGVLLLSHAAFAQTNGDKTFLQKSAQGNVAEVELAKLALNKATKPQVKSFARRMVRDHEMLERNMEPLLERAGLQPPASLDTEQQKLFNRLNGLSGNDFDREYVKAMDLDHHKDLGEFKKEIRSTRDPDLKAAAQSGQKVIAQHTQMIDAISAKMHLGRPGHTERDAGRVIR